MKNIEVDFEVWKQIVTKLKDEKDTPNDVLRREFKLPQQTRKPPSAVAGFWTSRGGQIPIGTKLRARHKGKTYDAQVTPKGIEYAGDPYTDVSNAATEIAKSPRNGWTFFEAQLPGENDWRPLSVLRSR